MKPFHISAMMDFLLCMMDSGIYSTTMNCLTNASITRLCTRLVTSSLITQESDLAEAEANFFAKFALAPPVLIHKLEPQDEIQLANLFDISLEAATYAMEYYRKWLEYGGSEYKDYEIRLLNLFGLAV